MHKNGLALGIHPHPILIKIHLQGDTFHRLSDMLDVQIRVHFMGPSGDKNWSFVEPSVRRIKHFRFSVGVV